MLSSILKPQLTDELADVNPVALTVGARRASVRPGAVAPERCPEVDAQSSV